MSLILTTYNEEEALPGLLDDVLSLEPPPAEFVVVDAGSHDRTGELLASVSRKMMDRGIIYRVGESPGANIAQGRNRAIANASGSVIAVTDAGCRLPRDWYGTITAAIVAGEADLVGGFFEPIAHSRLQRVVAALTTQSGPDSRFRPSSRSVAFSRALWDKVGGYPEYLRYAEDSAFNDRCISAGARYRVEERAKVRWEVRRTLRKTLRQYFNYASGDARASRMTRSLVLCLLYCGTVLGLVVAGWVGAAGLILCGYPALLVLRRRAVRVEDAPLAWTASLLLQWARCAGFLEGTLSRVLRRGRS